MLLFFKACIVHVVFDAFVNSLSLSDSQERGAGHLKKKIMSVLSIKIHVRPEWVQICKCYCISNHFCIFNQLALELLPKRKAV